MVEFASIIATLHISEFSQSLTPSSSSHPFAQIRTTMTSSLYDLISLFYGYDANDEGGQQDPAKFIETLTFAIDGQVYTDKIRK